MKRFLKVINYGWQHSKCVFLSTGKKNRIYYFLDIICTYLKYHVYSNEYINEKFYLLTPQDKINIGKKYLSERNRFDDWWKDFYANRAFLAKFTSRKWEESSEKMIKRNKAYQKRYNMGANCHVEYNVEISRQHMLDGTISIGNNVLLCKNSFIDYSGDIKIEDGVKISADVKIETHGHTSFTNALQKGDYKTPLVIEKNVQIGIGTIIMEGCNRIGREARIGAGAVVRTNIPPYAIVLGNPAKIVGFTITPQQLEEHEAQKYFNEEKTSIENFSKNYEKYVSSRFKEIRTLLKL